MLILLYKKKYLNKIYKNEFWDFRFQNNWYHFLSIRNERINKGLFEKTISKNMKSSN
jgi:hypothetical protein